jgi:hypothetical protein
MLFGKGGTERATRTIPFVPHRRFDPEVAQSMPSRPFTLVDTMTRIAGTSARLTTSMIRLLGYCLRVSCVQAINSLPPRVHECA